MLDTLVKIADKLDQEGKYELASKVDDFIKSMGARPKAPLKKMDEKVKHDLLKFLHTVAKNLEESAEALEELFRRLRYFGVDDNVKDFGLDKALKDISKLMDSVGGANNRFYEISFGKKPSKSDLEELKKKLTGEEDEQDARDPLSFFESQTEQNADDGEEDAEEQDAKMPFGHLPPGKYAPSDTDPGIVRDVESGQRYPESLEEMKCPDCENPLPLGVQRSAAGYFVGRFCPECGPYSRESGYFKSSEEAQEELNMMKKMEEVPKEISFTEPEEEGVSEDELQEFWGKGEEGV
jgi:hypothetical protein